MAAEITLTGKTYPLKAQLKSLGLRYAGGEWYGPATAEARAFASQLPAGVACEIRVPLEESDMISPSDREAVVADRAERDRLAREYAAVTGDERFIEWAALQSHVLSRVSVRASATTCRESQATPAGRKLLWIDQLRHVCAMIEDADVAAQYQKCIDQL